jgi:hypothetical protein
LREPEDLDENLKFESPRFTHSHSDTETEIKISMNEERGDNNTSTKKQRAVKIWRHIRTFENETEAKNFIVTEKCWSKRGERETVDGTKIYYRCNLVKKRGPQCSAALCLLYEAESSEVILFQTNSVHTHDSLDSAGKGLADSVKQEIKRLNQNLRLKPREILIELGKLSMPTPSKNQLYKYLATLKKNNTENQ